MKEALIAKLQQGRPVNLTPAEAEFLVETLRQAVASTLELPTAEVADDARVFDTLGMDSVDVFDVLDQMGETFEMQVALEELPESFLRGGGETTFRAFAEGLLAYFRTPPAAPGPP